MEFRHNMSPLFAVVGMGLLGSDIGYLDMVGSTTYSKDKLWLDIKT